MGKIGKFRTKYKHLAYKDINEIRTRTLVFYLSFGTRVPLDDRIRNNSNLRLQIVLC